MGPACDSQEDETADTVGLGDGEPDRDGCAQAECEDVRTPNPDCGVYRFDVGDVVLERVDRRVAVAQAAATEVDADEPVGGGQPLGELAPDAPGEVQPAV